MQEHLSPDDGVSMAYSTQGPPPTGAAGTTGYASGVGTSPTSQLYAALNARGQAGVGSTPASMATAVAQDGAGAGSPKKKSTTWVLWLIGAFILLAFIVLGIREYVTRRAQRPSVEAITTTTAPPSPPEPDAVTKPKPANKTTPTPLPQQPNLMLLQQQLEAHMNTQAVQPVLASMARDVEAKFGDQVTKQQAYSMAREQLKASMMQNMLAQNPAFQQPAVSQPMAGARPLSAPQSGGFSQGPPASSPLTTTSVSPMTHPPGSLPGMGPAPQPVEGQAPTMSPTGTMTLNRSVPVPMNAMNTMNTGAVGSPPQTNPPPKRVGRLKLPKRKTQQTA